MPHLLAQLHRTLGRWSSAWFLGLSLLAAGPAATAAPQNPIAGVRFDAQAQLAGQPAASTEAVLAQAGAKRLQMRMLVEVPTAEFVKAFHKGVERNTPAAQQAGLAERMARFDALIQPLGKVRKGDLVNLDSVPGQGMQLSLNGKALGAAIPGDDFYA
ncbi:MAG: hypothetical protein CFE45_27700, partial [Burkholderiales bacterium PBB5]